MDVAFMNQNSSGLLMASWILQSEEILESSSDYGVPAISK
jgi:hypothetical protein